MSGTLRQQAKSDWERFSTEGGFETPVKFIAPEGEEAEFSTLAFDVRLDFETEGGDLSVNKNHITFPESKLIAANYPYRDQVTNNINLSGHCVEWTNTSGILKKYSIEKVSPDQTVGMITCFLANFE